MREFGFQNLHLPSCRTRNPVSNPFAGPRRGRALRASWPGMRLSFIIFVQICRRRFPTP